MVYAVIEILLGLCWAYAFISRARRTGGAAAEELQVLLIALPTTVIMEMRAEIVQRGMGTYYPASLAFFPGFHFPVAIVLAGSLFAWALYALSRRLSLRLAGPAGWRFHGTHLVFFLLFLLVSRLVEAVAVGLDYWQWHFTPGPLAMWIGGYMYYFRFAFPAWLVAKFFAWHRRRP